MKTLVKILLAIVFILAIVANCCEAAKGAEPVSDEPTDVIYSYDYIRHVQCEYENAQFLTRIANKQIVNDYLWLIDHSIYEVSVDTWNAFVKRYNVFKNAQRQYLQGWNIEFDDIL